MLSYIRYGLGWSDPTNIPQENCVLVGGHTSYWDAIIAMLYLDVIPFVVVIKPQMMEGFLAPFFRAFGFIPAPKLEDRGTGGVQQIVTALRLQQKQQKQQQYPFCLLISPKGTIQNKPWRSGYQHIAREVGWPIKVIGVDYSKRTLTIVDPSGTDSASLQQQLSQFCPLVPSRSEYPILCDYDPWELACPIDLLAVSNLCMLVPAFQALWFGHVGIFSQTVFTMYISWIYHLSRESQYIEIDSMVAKGGAVFWLWSYPPITLPVFAITAVPAFIGLYYYNAGTPRIPSEPRGQYVYNHTLFHVWMSVAAWCLVFFTNSS